MRKLIDQFNVSNHRKLATAISLVMATTAPATVLATVDVDFYGSLRVQAETVNPDSGVGYSSGDTGSYAGLRDAYSRIGLNAGWQATESVKVFGQLEIPLDVANFAVQDPYNHERDIRVAQVGLETEQGTVAYGQMWLPYYNSVAYKVDRFSTYYSGYATFATFRAYNAISYYSPSFNGVSVGAGYIIGTDSTRADTRSEDSYQLTLNYANNGTDVSLAVDNQRGANDTQLFGFAIGQQIDNLYIGAKAEVFNSDDNSGGYGADGTTAYNLYADYTVGSNTFKLMLAEVENYGETIVHVGVDHQVDKNLKVFAEFYKQEELNAIANQKANFTDSLTGGGNVVAAGLRYDF